MDEKEMTVQEAAEYAQKGHTTVRRWLRLNWIPYSQNPLTRRITITKSAVDKLLNEGPPKQSDN